jgi:hypothetical protein
MAQIFTLFTGVTSNSTPPERPLDISLTAPRPNRTYQAKVSGTGAITATITFFGSNVSGEYPATAFGTITLSGTNTVTDNFVSGASWNFVQCTVANVTGTAATVSATVGM